MSVEELREFFERIGRRVIESDSGYWHDAGGSVYVSIPYDRILRPSREEIEQLFGRYRPVGIKYSAMPDGPGRPGAIYACQDRSYDLGNLHPKMRAPVRRGLENCRVQEIDFDFLRRHGLSLNRDTLERQGRDDLGFSEPRLWAQFCEAGKAVAAVQAWGALTSIGLAAYAITFRFENSVNISYQNSRTDALRLKPNHALTFQVTQYCMNWPGVEQVAYGLESLAAQHGLDVYKRRMGFKKTRVNYVVVLRPLLRRLLRGGPGAVLLQGLKTLARPARGRMAKAVEILDIARQSAGAPPGL